MSGWRGLVHSGGSLAMCPPGMEPHQELPESRTFVFNLGSCLIEKENTKFHECDVALCSRIRHSQNFSLLFIVFCHLQSNVAELPEKVQEYFNFFFRCMVPSLVLAKALNSACLTRLKCK